jgi:hypothetical protein
VSTTATAPILSGTLYVGPWRSIFMNASISNAAGVWQIRIDYAVDANNTQIVYTTTALVGNGVPRIGWQPVVGQYATFTITRLVGNPGDTMTIVASPSLLDAPQASRILTTPLIQRYEDLVGAGFQVFLNAAYSYPGPAVFTLRSNQSGLVVDIRAMNAAGTFDTLMRYQTATPNQLGQFTLQLPDSPLQIAPFNTEAHADATYDAALSPA